MPSTPWVDAPAFGRLRVGVGRMGKVRPPGRLAVHGDGVARVGGAGAAPERAAASAPMTTARRDGAKRERVRARSGGEG